MFNQCLFATKLKRISQTNNTLAGHCTKYYYIHDYLLFYTLANICNIGDIVLTLLPGYLARRARVYDGNSIYDGHLGGGGGYL